MDELALMITDAGGEELSFSTTSDDPNRLVVIGRIKTKRGVGFDTCEFVIPRDPLRRYDDLDLLQRVKVVFPDGDVAFEGAITAAAPEEGRVQFTATGDYSQLKDVSNCSEIYRDQSTERWGGTPLDRQTQLLSSSFLPTDGNAVTGGLKLTFAPMPWTNPGKPCVESWYTAPAGAYIGNISGLTSTRADPVATKNVGIEDDDTVTGTDIQAFATGTSAFDLDATATTRRFAYIDWSYNGTNAAVDNQERSVTVTTLAVTGTHGLASLTPDNVIKNVLDRWCPGITYDSESITAHDFEIEHLVVEEVDPAEIVARANAVANWNFEVWEDSKAWWGPSPLLDEPDYLFDTEGTAKLSAENKSVNEDYPVNGCDVFYTNALTNRREFVGPDDDYRLRDDNDENPCNKQNRDRRLKLSIEYPCSENNAIQLGSVRFAEALITSRAGSGSVTGTVLTADGQEVPAGKIRAGKVGRYLHEASGREIFETDYQPSISKVDLKFDNNPPTLDAILARIGVRTAKFGSRA